MRQRTTGFLLASILFLASGSAALIYQVIWQRVLGIFSGLHIYSVTMIVTAFMAGLGFGSLLGGRIADRLSLRRAVLAFAACELTIGAFALVSPWLYYDLAYVRLGFLVTYPLALPFVHLVLLLVPTLLMGASLPLLARGLVRDTEGAALVVGTLYGVNTLGAALGAFAAVWLLIGDWGFVGTVRAASALNFAAAVGAMVIVARLPRGPVPGHVPEQPTASAAHRVVPPDEMQPFRLRTWAVLYALSGFLALSLEILWFRILDVSIKSSPFTFGHLLGVFLLFLALGSLVGARIAHLVRRADLVFLWGQWGVSVSAGLALVLLCWLPVDRGPLASLSSYWATDSGLEVAQIRGAWAGWTGGPLPPLLRLVVQIYGVLPLGLLAVPTFLMGLTYAFIQRTVQTDLHTVGWRVGVIQTANIVGSIFGSLLTGSFFLGWFGTPLTVRLIVLTGSVFGLLALARRSERPSAAGTVTVAGVALVLAAAVPTSEPFWARFHGSAPDRVLVAEDTSSIVALQRLSDYSAVLRVNGTGHSVLPYGGPHTILGALPVLMHPDPREALIIGLGAGNTAWAAAAAPTIERVDVYEIARPEYEVLRRFQGQWFEFPPVDQVLADPRIHLTFSDGRLALRRPDARYDVIEADALEPYMAYSGNLYSREFFELAASALKPGGMVCSYTPTARTRRTIAQSFPHVLYFHAADRWQIGFMVGTLEPLEFDRRAVLARLDDERTRRYLREAGLEWQLTREVRDFLAVVQVERIGPHNREAYTRGDINTDLFPRDEYQGASADD